MSSSSEPEDDSLYENPGDHLELRQQSSAEHIAWSLEQAVFHDCDPEFERLRNDRAEYNRTLVRLIGIVWVTGMSADNIVNEEQRRLSRVGYSEEFQAYCDEVAEGLWGVGR